MSNPASVRQPLLHRHTARLPVVQVALRRAELDAWDSFVSQCLLVAVRATKQIRFPHMDEQRFPAMLHHRQAVGRHIVQLAKSPRLAHCAALAQVPSWTASQRAEHLACSPDAPLQLAQRRACPTKISGSPAAASLGPWCSMAAGW